MDDPVFQDGKLVIKNNKGEEFVLYEETWIEHILGDRSRFFYKDNFDKIIETLADPDRIIQSKKDIDVHLYEKKFNDLYMFENAITGMNYNIAVVNTYDKMIRTIYISQKPKKGHVIWDKTTSKPDEK